MQGAQALNAFLDAGPRSKVIVEGNEARGSRGGIYCGLTMPTGEWLARTEACQPGRKAVVTVGAGAFGARWVESVE